MDSGLPLSRVTVRIQNEWFGPNFVRGLALQRQDYTVVSPTLAVLEFQGGVNDSITIVQNVNGSNFGTDENGRFTGKVDSYVAYDQANPENGWSFDGLNTTLDHMNSEASSRFVTFQDLLLVPLVYNFIGAQYDDFYIFGSFDDIGRGFEGNDQYFGLAGNDLFIGHSGHDLLAGGTGNDTLLGGQDSDTLRGGEGDDEIAGGRGTDRILGGDSNDSISGGTGEDVIFGQGGNDTVDGGDHADRLLGGGGTDSLMGANGDDLVKGQDGNDSLDGGDGDDLMIGGAGSDSMLGGAGFDTLRGLDGDDTGSGGDDDDLIYGMSGTDFLFGDDGNDTVYGGADSDQVFGNDGDDILSAGSAGDYLSGGTGNDTMAANLAGGIGDLSVDTFVMEAAFGEDRVTDFELGFDFIAFLGYQDGDVTAEVVGEDVLLRTNFGLSGEQRVWVEGVGDTFDLASDVVYIPFLN